MPEAKEIYRHLREIGDRGEEIIQHFLEKKGVVFRQTPKTFSHKIDFTCERPSDGKMYFVEVKTKKSFLHEVEETGFEVKYWNKYAALEEESDLEIFFIFVDIRRKEAYGDWMKNLKKIKTCGFLPHLLTWGNEQKEMNPCVFFPVSKMKKLCDLTNDQVDYVLNGDLDTRQARAQAASQAE